MNLSLSEKYIGPIMILETKNGARIRSRCGAILNATQRETLIQTLCQSYGIKREVVVLVEFTTV